MTEEDDDIQDYKKPSDLTEENLKASIIEIQKYMEDTGQLMSFKPTKVMYQPGDLKALGLTHEDVVNMIKENT